MISNPKNDIILLTGLYPIPKLTIKPIKFDWNRHDNIHQAYPELKKMCNAITFKSLDI